MKVTAATVAVLLTSLGAAAQTFTLQSLDGLELLNVNADVATHRGRKAVHLTENLKEGTSGDTIAILEGSDFQNGVIEAEMASVPAAGANEGARGFVGIAFRVKDVAHYEAFYLRPTNGRADDQLRRNHSTQYISHPEYPWHRLRRENPGVYESYVDLVPGEWTRIRILVTGNQARLFVHGSDQPVLIVNDLKHGDSRGKVALWIGSGTEAWFSKVTVKSAK
jgi:hypothetical protein